MPLRQGVVLVKKGVFRRTSAPQISLDVALVQATPDKLSPAMRRCITTVSRKYDEIARLPNLPELYDPKVMAGRHLERENAALLQSRSVRAVAAMVLWCIK